MKNRKGPRGAGEGVPDDTADSPLFSESSAGDEFFRSGDILGIVLVAPREQPECLLLVRESGVNSLLLVDLIPVEELPRPLPQSHHAGARRRMAIEDAITAAVKGSSRIEARGFAVRF